MIKSIRVVNVRGIGDKTFKFDGMVPNKVHLLIASNGFGKSSIATAFDSLNNSRLKLKERDCFRHEESRDPKLVVEVEREGLSTTLTADKNRNEIAGEFSTFVIRGPRKVKAFQRPTETGHQVPVGEFIIEDIELCNIPEKAEIDYQFRKDSHNIGGSSKAALNISKHLESLGIINAFLESQFSEKVLTKKLEASYTTLLNKVRLLSGDKDEIFSTIENKLWLEVEAAPELDKLCKCFTECEKGQSLLAAIQLIEAGRKNLGASKKAKKWAEYKEDRERVKELMASYNPDRTWIDIKVKETDGKLVISLPKPEMMSNGQRDFLCFVSQLLEFEFRKKKKNTLLVIDEVFDYLDYANVIACQYYIKKFVDTYSKRGDHVYPILLTHLDPSVFNSFIFSRKLQKNHYLDKVQAVNPEGGLFKIIQCRALDKELEDIFAKYHAHHSLEECDQREMFERKKLKKNWGCSKTFKNYCREQVHIYLSKAGIDVDYLAVCLALRVHIEKLACDRLSSPKNSEFTGTHQTIEKLKFAERNNASVPELHYLLAGLYNSALHSNPSQDDFLTPVVTKLQNGCIREMIREVFQPQDF